MGKDLSRSPKKESQSLPSKPSTPPEMNKALVAGGGLNTGKAIIPTEDLTEEQRQELIMKQAHGAIDSDNKARDAGIGLGVMREKMDHMTRTAKDASEGGLSVTINGAHKDPYGGVDIRMGNTEEAKKAPPTIATGNNIETILKMGFGLAVLIVIAIVVIKFLGI